MRPVIVVIEQRVAASAQRKPLQQRNKQQRQEVRRIEPGEAVDDKFSGGRRAPQINHGEDKTLNDPEHLHRVEPVFVKQ